MTCFLADPPKDSRSKEIWLQNVAGFIIFQNMRNYAIERIPRDIGEDIKEQIIKGIDDSIYGLMMIMDGVSGTLENSEYRVQIENRIVLEKDNKIVQELNTLDGDGMCMGFHSWKQNEFGEDKIGTLVE
jgi:hypothetical protein